MISSNETDFRDAVCAAERILRQTELFIFDMDGTIYLGEQVFPFAVRFLKHLRKSGRKVLFFTNNASHHPAFYEKRLTRMGFDPHPGELLTAGDVMIRFLKEQHPGQPVYLVGTPELTEQFQSEGILLSENADIVVSSFDTTLTYEKLRIACDRIRAGAVYYCTHPDFNCPTETGFIPDSGAIAALITASTGITPRFFGKPCGDALDVIAMEKGVKREKICMFGDRLYTDIDFCIQNGASAILVLTGETSREQALTRPADRQPSAILSSLDAADRILFPDAE